MRLRLGHLVAPTALRNIMFAGHLGMRAEVETKHSRLEPYHPTTRVPI